MCLQAVVPWVFLEIADMCILAVVAVVAAGAFQRSLASGRVVKVEAYAVSLELGSSPFKRCSTFVCAVSPSSGSAATRTEIAALVVLPACIFVPERALLKGVPFLDGVEPPVSHLSVGQRGFVCDGSAGCLAQDGVNKLRHQSEINDWFTQRVLIVTGVRNRISVYVYVHWHLIILLIIYCLT